MKIVTVSWPIMTLLASVGSTPAIPSMKDAVGSSAVLSSRIAPLPLKHVTSAPAGRVTIFGIALSLIKSAKRGFVGVCDHMTNPHRSHDGVPAPLTDSTSTVTSKLTATRVSLAMQALNEPSPSFTVTFAERNPMLSTIQREYN